MDLQNSGTINILLGSFNNCFLYGNCDPNSKEKTEINIVFEADCDEQANELKLNIAQKLQEMGFTIVELAYGSSQDTA